ncbi:hypothetical protein STANM309S_02895 [Streptomyces tanashiensis]
MAATSWTGQELEAWLAGHLTTAFGVGGALARRLVEARLVLPVVDGLDELDPPGAAPYSSRAAQLLRLLNGWQHGTQPAAVLVTCRRGFYDGLMRVEAHLRAAAVVRLAPVDGEQGRAFLRRSVADTEAGLRRWQPVLDALATGPREDHVTPAPAVVRLRRVLATPWRLSLATAVYQERSAEGHYLRDPATLLRLAESGTLHRHLLDLYVPALLATRGDGTVPPEGPARRWLAVLASYLDDNRNGRQAEGRTLSATDLVLPELWPLVGAEPTRRAIRWAGLAWARSAGARGGGPGGGHGFLGPTRFLHAAVVHPPVRLRGGPAGRGTTAWCCARAPVRPGMRSGFRPSDAHRVVRSHDGFADRLGDGFGSLRADGGWRHGHLRRARRTTARAALPGARRHDHLGPVRWPTSWRSPHCWAT